MEKVYQRIAIFIVKFCDFLDHKRMKSLLIILFLLLSGCTSQKAALPEATGTHLKITEINPNKWTALTRQDLEHLLQIYDLAPLIFTYDIHIQSRVIPHSHPILTLNTRYAERPNKLLSVFIHEQLHWWVEGKKSELTGAVAELRVLYPEVPQQGGARSVYSTYLHLIICFLEFEAINHYLGKAEASKIIKEFIEVDKIYPWIYTQVQLKNTEIAQIVNKNKLRPANL